MIKVWRCRHLSVLPVSGVGHGVRRRQRLVRPHRFSGAHRPSFQHDTPRLPAAGGCSSASPPHHHRTALPTHCTQSITPFITTNNTKIHPIVYSTTGQNRSKATAQRNKSNETTPLNWLLGNSYEKTYVIIYPLVLNNKFPQEYPLNKLKIVDFCKKFTIISVGLQRIHRQIVTFFAEFINQA